MAYFLGRDVKVGICSEEATHGVAVSAATPDTLAASTTVTGEVIELFWPSDGAVMDGNSNSNPFTDVTSVDLTLGKVDEDIAYMGLRTALKAEIKNESTLVITKKKTSTFWDLVFMKARHGVGGSRDGDIADENSITANQLQQPTIQYGYRLAVQLKVSNEVITLSNCVVADKSTSLNADGVTEETITFTSQVEPLIDTKAYITATAAAAL